MRLIGFSTGSIALGDYRKALGILSDFSESINSVELSSLRESELEPLVGDLDSLHLSQYEYVSFHAPSKLEKLDEKKVVKLLAEVVRRHYNVIIHPDVISDFGIWQTLGNRLLIENMDKRKRAGRTLEELEYIFSKLPAAQFCFDIGHSRQVDPLMYEASVILSKYSNKLKEVHISEVNSKSKHEIMSYETILAYKKVAHLIPQHIPIIIESPVNEIEIETELKSVYKALSERELEYDLA